ncbi:metal-dependent hydrolase [Halocynthiibacter namhaensis]|uniref:metal-dependent hydrolase n=1 Tax=Halocynthiibacter namhaensis TaxID=1290553 RepID=UPI000579561F|nr:metal-dependent hydrolase [Halocynthiibacter namhaensis]
MITAHLPSGYILARATGCPRSVYPFALLGSVLPDFDMLWFHLVDMRAFHHHKYWVHAPGFWIMIAVATLIALKLFVAKHTRFPVITAACMFYGAIFVHLILDSLAGSIMWLWPFSDQLYVLVDVPSHYENWVLSFLLHWTFLAEIMVWSIAVFLYLGRKRESKINVR